MCGWWRKRQNIQYAIPKYLYSGVCGEGKKMRSVAGVDANFPHCIAVACTSEK
jgi:hypothetical protein